ncbi:MAG: 30S ribosome-binding factor RbfA [Bryobacterales bacterium]|nr:30S ribosome-binding factor RbfA [Bryobacterales bacterium]
MEERRKIRLAEAIRDELAELIVYELADPRIQLAGVTDVHLSPDGKRADVLVHTTGAETEQAATMEALAVAAGFLRRQLSLRLALRHVPDLRFRPDSEAASGERLEVLWKRAQKWRRKLERGSGPEAKSGGTS